MTGQDLLDQMEVLNPELQLQSGEANVTTGLRALNMAQRSFEALAAVRKDIKGGQTGTVVTSANTETTAFPTGLYRIDKLQLLDASTSRPKWEVTNLKRTGGHFFRNSWPYLLLSSNSTGEPVNYWTNGRNIYWSPLPSGTHTLRWYGWQAASAITAGGTFAYEDIVALPLATFAVRLIKLGVEDNTQDITALATGAFKETLDALANFNRDGAEGLEYTEYHTT